MRFLKENDTIKHTSTRQANIAYRNGEKEVIIYLYESGNIPHVHISDPEDETFGCCVRLDKAEYFRHGNKQSVLNAKDKNEFVECMNEVVNTRIGPLTNWDIAVII